MIPQTITTIVRDDGYRSQSGMMGEGLQPKPPRPVDASRIIPRPAVILTKVRTQSDER